MAQFAVKGYEVDALDYIVKPVGYSNFELKLKKRSRWSNRIRIPSPSIKPGDLYAFPRAK